MPTSYYDRFADTHWGGRAAQWFWGSGKEPPQTLFHRSLPHLLGGAAYVADYGLQSYYSMFRGTKRRIYATPGGAGMGGAGYMTRARMEVGAAPALNSRYRTRPARRNRVMRGTPKELRAQYRLKRYLPLHITHEETTEVRARPGSQAVVQFQAERLLPTYGNAGTGSPTGGLNNGVNRKSDNTLGTYNGGIAYNSMYRFTTPDARSVGELTHRSDWTMFTNPSWRDGLAAMNGQYSTQALTKAGYVTPYMNGTAAYWRRLMVDDVNSATDTVDPVFTYQATDYYHLAESITCTVTNNSVVPTTITFYECVLAHDVRLVPSLSSTDAAITWGALPCPIELWRAGRQMAAAEQGGIKIVDGRAGMAGGTVNTTVQGDDGDGAVGTRMGAPGDAVAAVYTPDTTTTCDVDHQYVRPGGPLLNHWYKVVPTSRTLGPGMTTTFSVSVRFNKRIPGLWWESLLGVKGMSRTFFMTARPYQMVGSTGVEEEGASGAGSRLMVMGSTDLTMKWRKHKSFTRTDRAPNRRIYYRAYMPEVDAVVARGTEDNDAEGDLAGAAMGADD